MVTQYLIYIPQQDLRDRIGPGASRSTGLVAGLVLTTTDYVTDDDHDRLVTATWTSDHTGIYVHLHDLDWGIEMDATLDDGEAEDWTHLGESVRDFADGPTEWLDPADDTIPLHIREALDL